jgi:hypothetical protein
LVKPSYVFNRKNQYLEFINNTAKKRDLYTSMGIKNSNLSLPTDVIHSSQQMQRVTTAIDSNLSPQSSNIGMMSSDNFSSLIAPG